MTITSFNPLIVTKNADPVIKLFEELGFQKRHSLDANTGKAPLISIRMKDANGFYVDISEPNIRLSQNVTAIRMNVDDFDEAYEMLAAHGFKNYYGDKTVETESAKSALMLSPSGFAINLVQHIKK